MDCIISSGRMEYLMGKKPSGCIFCKGSIRDETLVLFEGKSCYVIMNKYPYASGHVLVVPFRHIDDVSKMTAEEKTEIMDLMDLSVKVLRRAMNPQGFNIGMNLGNAAGAGVDSHIHLHIVPRWIGDTNYATVVGNTRFIPEGIEETHKVLLPYFQNNKEV
jgi:ATP adenylyltransferase